jgi:2-iminobutanoate/2-iminopropanoate deaminase
MSEKIVCFNEIPGAPKAVGPYSPAVKVGNIYYLSGQVGLNPESGKLVEGGIAAQTEQVIRNVSAVLASLKLNLNNIAKSTIFLTDMGDFQTVNSIYGSAFGNHKPARSTIQVAALPLGAMVEIEVLAVE